MIRLQPGVVQQGGNVFVRGSRPDQTSYQIDGVSINNLLAGGVVLPLPMQRLNRYKFNQVVILQNILVQMVVSLRLRLKLDARDGNFHSLRKRIILPDRIKNR